MIIDNINYPKDLKKLNKNELVELSNEIRELLINKASNYGGHLASNLGTVELTIALHYVFNSPVDKFIFDVSHQSYTHKILTGRKKSWLDEKEYGKVSGFTNPKESEHDIFNIGHTSTSISLACGLAKARDINKTKENIIAVIGDASLDGGEAFEALNYASELNSGLIIVVNDNNMSIPENHGALCNLLTELRNSDGKVKNNYFESLGLDYVFVKNGHDIEYLIEVFEKVKNTKKPVVIHCCTTKGKGYSYAENNKEKYHWTHPFNRETGEFYTATAIPKENYGAIVGKYLMDKIKKDSKVVAVTASVPSYIGFNSERRKEAGSQFVDVGISEQNAVTMCAGIAKNGGKPVFVTGSSFYQRAYDQIQQEMCINKCPATMLVSASGIYGHTSDAHIGLYDMVIFGNIPNLIYLAPTNAEEYIAMLDWSIDQNDYPVAIRIPWNGVNHTDKGVPKEYLYTRYSIEKEGNTVAIIALGSFYQLGERVVKNLKEKYNIDSTLINPRFITGIDEEVLEKLKDNHKLIVTLEDGIVSGGFGSKIAQYYGLSDMKVLNRGFSMDIPTTFTANEMLEKNRLTEEQIIEDIRKIIN